MGKDDDRTPGLQPLAAIDRVVHEPARLAIMSYLCVLESADFLFLMRRTGLTRGNLSSHMSKLESAGYVNVRKAFVGKVPRTTLSLTARGRRALEGYRAAMQEALDAARPADGGR